MIHDYISKVIVFLGMLIVSVGGFADNANASMATESYTINNLNNVTTNHANCEDTYQVLQNWSKNPITFQFAKNKSGDLKDSTGQLKDGTRLTIQDTSKGNKVRRLVVGHFTLNNESIEYAVHVASDKSRKDYNHAYPLVFTSHDGQCMYTAVMVPDPKTITNWQASVK